MPLASNSNLPPVLPGIPSKIPLLATSSLVHGQDLSVLKLQQQQDMDRARVSINSVTSGAVSVQPSTSIFHSAGGVQASTSLYHGAASSVLPNRSAPVGADRLAKIKQMAKERQQSAEKKAVAADKTPRIFHPGTGVAFRKTGVSSYKKIVGKFIRSQPASYRNVSVKDREVLVKTVQDTLSHKVTGSAVTRRDRLKMRRNLLKSYKQEGNITKEDFKDFTKIVKKIK